MKKLLSTFFLLPVLFLVSCSGKEDDAPKISPQPISGCRPVSSTGYHTANQNQYDTTEHFYNSDARLTGIHTITQTGDEQLKIIYDSDGNIYQLTEADGTIWEERRYNGGRLNKIIKFGINNGQYKAVIELYFTYDMSGKLIRKTYEDLFPVQGNIPLSYSTYQYNAAGLISTDSAFSIKSGKTSFVHKVEYLYDDKRGIGAYGFILNDWFDPYLYFPHKHNITSMRVTQASGLNYSKTFQYQYNSQEYPTEISIFRDNHLVLNRRIIYNCF